MNTHNRIKNLHKYIAIFNILNACYSIDQVDLHCKLETEELIRNSVHGLRGLVLHCLQRERKLFGQK